MSVLSSDSKVMGCLICGYRTANKKEIQEWSGCPQCSPLSPVEQTLKDLVREIQDNVNLARFLTEKGNHKAASKYTHTAEGLERAHKILTANLYG